MAYTPGQVESAYKGIATLLELTGRAISLVPEPKRSALNADLNKLIARMTQISAQYPFRDMYAEMKNLVHGRANSKTQRAALELEIVRIFASQLRSVAEVSIPPTEAGKKAAAILKQSTPLFAKSRLFVDQLDAVFDSLREAMGSVVGGLKNLIVIGLIGLGLWWLASKAFRGPGGPPPVIVEEEEEEEPVRLTRSQRKKRKKARKLMRDSSEKRLEAQELLEDVPGSGVFS
ncbi:MAG: hypothetical protein JRD89_20220 [Deltaproteobacteria bacterium]|nr:hypothetical protein [Deltaproteobacteria bacterium]